MKIDYQATVSWYDFEESWTGWIINWVLMFPIFLVFFLAMAAMTCAALMYCGYRGSIFLPVCWAFWITVWSCVRHGT